MTKFTTIIGIIFFAHLIVSCNSEPAKTVEITEVDNSQTIVVDVKGYDLMKQKCFICHLEQPSFEKKSSMLAPPMNRIKEHYIPTFQNKEAFINAITNFVVNPQKENVMMPGAVRRFNIMPNLGITKDEAMYIAAAIYNTDFETMPKINKSKEAKLSLNNGEKWKLKKESIEEVEKINEMLENFNSNNINDYAQLGQDVFGGVKKILLDDDYNNSIVDQLHYFFGATEGSIHKLQSTKSIEEARKIVNDLKSHFLMFNNYFE